MGQICCGSGKKGPSGETKNIVIFLSSVRPYRMANRVGKFVKDKVESAGMSATMIDPLELDFDILDVPFQFMSDKDERSLPSDWLKETNDKIQSADGYIIISAEYNSSIPPALSNMLNNFAPESFDNRPVGLITYSMGGFGGIRAQTILPLILSELWMLPVPTRVTIPTVQDTFSEDGKCSERKVTTTIEILIKEVGWYADAILSQKNIKPLNEMTALEKIMNAK